MADTPRPGPRERLLRSASRLTYERGVGVGVDAILTDADATRRSLYQHFGSKDGLIAAMLHVASERDLAGYRAALDAGGDEPRARILALFAGLDAITRSPGFRGCRFIAADLALSDLEHPAHAEVRAHKDGLRALLAHELTEGGHPDPKRGARELVLLVDAVLVSGAMAPRERPTKLVLGFVERVLNEVAGSEKQH